MGPRHFSRGTRGPVPRCHRYSRASMGPRHFSRGTMTWSIAASSTGELQWGRGISAAELTASGMAPNSPSMLQWGRGISAAELWILMLWYSVSTRCFNGAAAFQPRNWVWRGNSAHVVMCFNGAAAFQPRNFDLTCERMLEQQLLQWGRGISAAELPIEPARAGRHVYASMGPRHFSRGTLPIHVYAYQDISRFNGAAAFQPRNYISTGRTSDRLTASMGPRHFSRGTRSKGTQHDSRRTLQWGRGISAAELVEPA